MSDKKKKVVKEYGKLVLWILAAICGFCGLMLKFGMTGRDYIGYIFMGFACLIVIYDILISRKMKKLLIGLSTVLLVGTVVFAVAETQVILSARTDKDIDTEYMIVLGAGVHGTRPSATLQDRLQAAYEYMKEHEDVIAIVSGGKGNGEDISEAEAMRIWLEEHGIEKERIIKEDKSTSTVENLEFSFEIMKERGADPKDGVAIVSSEYHLLRAKNTAKDMGVDAWGIAAKTSIPTVKVNYFIREALGVLYSALFL